MTQFEIEGGSLVQAVTKLIMTFSTVVTKKKSMAIRLTQNLGCVGFFCHYSYQKHKTKVLEIKHNIFEGFTNFREKKG